MGLKKFRLVVIGENFLVKLDGRLSRCGFKAVRFVEADAAQEARERVVELFRRELKDRVLNVPPDSPQLVIEDAEELDSYEGRTEAGQGFEWFASKAVAAPRGKRYEFRAV